MAGAKYRYNTRTLSYEKVEPGIKGRIFRILYFLAAGLVFAVVIVFFFNIFFESADEKKYKRENTQLKLQYEILNRRMDQMSTVLEGIQQRDDNIYRSIFEAEPIPENIRKGGIGGVNRYKYLEGFDNSNLVVEAHEKIDKLSKQIYLQSVSFDEVIELAKQKEEMLMSIPAIQPVSNKDLTRMASGFGMRIHPIYKTKKMHEGMDFSAPVGTEVYATGSGKVTAVKRERGFGKYVIIDHGYGYQTVYAHLSDYNVRTGQQVNRGEVIGYVGNTGTSTAPHLHYEVRKKERAVNPANYYFNDLSPEEYDLMLQLSSQVNQSFD